jgi:transcriptional regulator with GAF, ATPase, and Fis domain
MDEATLSKHLQALIDVSLSLSSTVDPKKFIDIVLDKLFEAFPQADRGVVILYGPENRFSSAQFTKEIETRHEMAKVKLRQSGSGQEGAIKVSKAVLSRVRSTRQPVLFVNQDAGSSPLEAVSLMCAPLFIAQYDIGLIQLDTKNSEKRFTPSDLTFMTAVAACLSIVVRNSDLSLKLASLSAQSANPQAR